LIYPVESQLYANLYYPHPSMRPPLPLLQLMRYILNFWTSKKIEVSVRKFNLRIIRLVILTQDLVCLRSKGGIPTDGFKDRFHAHRPFAPKVLNPEKDCARHILRRVMEKHEVVLSVLNHALVSQQGLSIQREPRETILDFLQAD
jgi:hypothetical protein